MSEELTEKWAIITPENCQEINTMISGYKKQIEDLQGQLKEATQLILSCKRGVKSIYSTSIAYGHCWAERDAKSINTLINQYLRKWGLK